MMVGGASIQGVACDLNSDGAQWSLERLEFRAPGFTQVKVQGRLYPLGKGLGFAGATSVGSSDPKNLAAWLAGRTATAAQINAWHAKGDVTLGADRIAVERLQTEVGRGAIEGSVAYTWSAADKPARLDANLRAAELDLDSAFGFGASALSGLGLEPPREVALAIEIGRAKLAEVEARNVTARLALDAGGLAIERLSIADFGSASVEASGRIQTATSPTGNITIDLDARDMGGLVALAEKFSPPLAEPLRRLGGPQKAAALHANVSVASNGAGSTSGKLGLTGRIGPVQVGLTASAAGKREAFSPANLRALADTDLKLDVRLESDEPATLLGLIGLERLSVGEPRTARLSLSAQGPLSRDFKFDGKLTAGPIDAEGNGALRLPAEAPAQIDLDRIAGTIGGRRVTGKLALRFGAEPQADGTIEAEAIDAAATIAAVLGMPARRAGEPATGWSTAPLAWNASGLTGRIAFKTPRALFAQNLVAQPLQGVARFGRSGLVFEDVVGEVANGRFEGRMAFENGEDGLSARLRVGLSQAEAGAIFPGREGPAISGKLSIQGEVEGTGRSPAAFIGSLGGFGTVTLEAAKVTGLNPGVFDTVSRAVELGIPTEGHRIRDFVAGVLDGAAVPVPRATAGVSINAGQARFENIVIQATGADIEATARIDLTDAHLDALLTLTGRPSAAGQEQARPAVLVTLKGAVLEPRRTVDTGLLSSWLTMLTVERQAKQLDAMERAVREAAPPPAPTKPASPASEKPAGPAPEKAAQPAADPPPPAANASETKPEQREQATGASSELPAGAMAPPLPPPVEVPVAPQPRAVPQTEGAVAPRASSRPPALFGAQN
jgi:large subunit ribosomal protein L24